MVYAGALIAEVLIGSGGRSIITCWRRRRAT
jgi:hypothetical protein